MALKPGHCSGPCGRLVWRTGIAQRDVPPKTHAGDVVLLWPEPASLYAQTWTPTGHTVGIPYCQTCAPEIGEPGPDAVDGAAVVGYETAKDRYREWYSDVMGVFFRAWLADHLGYDEAMVEAAMSTWARDRMADEQATIICGNCGDAFGLEPGEDATERARQITESCKALLMEPDRVDGRD